MAHISTFSHFTPWRYAYAVYIWLLHLLNYCVGDEKLSIQSMLIILGVYYYTGVSITVPEGAIGRNQNEEIFIAASREDKERPLLLGNNLLYSSARL